MQLSRGCTREPETHENTQASCEHRQASRVGSTGRSFRGLVSHGPGSSRASPCEMFDTLACTGYDADAAVVPDLGGVASCRCRDQQVRSTQSASDGDDGDRHAREASGARPTFLGQTLHVDGLPARLRPVGRHALGLVAAGLGDLERVDRPRRDRRQRAGRRAAVARLGPRWPLWQLRLVAWFALTRSHSPRRLPREARAIRRSRCDEVAAMHRA